jgi:hypothetical protein
MRPGGAERAAQASMPAACSGRTPFSYDSASLVARCRMNVYLG